MKNITKLLKVIFIFFLLNAGGILKTKAQDNSGKEFWFTLFAETYLDHLPGIYIVSYYDCTVTIDYVARNPALDSAGVPDCTKHVVNVTGGVPLYVDIPFDLQALCWRYADNLTTPETVQKNGIRVTSTAPIALYSQFLAQASSEMTPILPIEEMGTEYIATAYREITFSDEDFNARTSITAIEDGTTVTFTLPANAWTSKHTDNTGPGLNAGMLHGPGSTWSVTLNRGETYTIISNDNESDDPTTTAGNDAVMNYTPAGSSVSINNNQGLNGIKISSNKKISVMGGTDCTWVGNDEYPGCGACDLTSTHLKPTDKWDTRFVSTQTLQRSNQTSVAVGLAAPPPPNIEPYPAGYNNMSVADYLLITARDNGTTVNISGQANYTKSLNAGQWFIYESPGISNPLTPPPGTSPGMTNHVIQSNKPIQVVQMMKGWQCDNNNPADPTQMLVIEENMWRDNYIVTNPTQYINNYFVFIIKEPSGTNVARSSLVLTVNNSNVPIPTGNSPTNDGTLGWSRMGTVEPYYYQRVNIAAGGAIRAKSVTAGGTTYPFAFYASGSTNASSYGYMGGAVCNLKAFAHADPGNICLGTPVTFKLDSTQNGGTVATLLSYNYTWTMMNGATTVYTFTGSGANPTNTYTATTAGTFTGYLVITDNAGCTARDTFNIVVNATIPPPTTGGNITVCQGQSINLTASSSVTGGTYAWTGPSGYTSAVQNPVISNASTAMSGTYSVIFTKNGCSSTPATVTVTVNPNAAITLTSAAATNAQTVCTNTAITNITYSITGGGTGASVTGFPAGVTGSYAGGIFTISGTPTATGTFNYTVTTTGNCTQASATGTLTVNPNAAIALSSAAGSNSQSICIGNAIASITYTVSGGGTGASASGLPAGVTGSFSGGTFTISGTPSATGTFNYTVTTSGTCTQATATGSIIVKPNAAITLTSAAGTNAQSICINTALTTITYSVTGGGTGATVTGLPAGVSSSFAGGILTISGTPTAAGTFNYTINTTGTCTQASASGSIIVKPNAAIALTSAAGTNAQTLCVSTAITSISYSVTGGGTGASVSGLPAGVTGSFSGGTFTISGTPTATGTFNYTVTTSGTCTQAAATGSIVVSPNAAIALTSAAGTNAQTKCSGTAITTITYAVTGGGTGATVSGLPAGVNGSFAGGTFTISGTPTATGTFNYTVTTTGTCTQATATGSIIVNPNAAITLTSAAGTNAQTVCTNAAITGITYSVMGGGTGATVSGLPAGVTGSFAGGTFSISGTPTATGTFNYTVTTSGTCTQAIATGSIVVNPNAAISLTSAAGSNAQSLCANTAITTISYAVSGGGTGATVSGLPAGTSGSFAGGIFTISGTPTASGTFNYTVTTTGSCTQATATGSITVNPLPVISSVPTTNETSCGAGDGTITINATGTGLTYSINGGTSFVAGNIFTGLSGGSYAIAVQSSAGCTQSGGAVSISSAGAPPAPTANANPNPLCEGASLTLSIASPVVGETYNWSGPGAYSATGASVTISNVTTAMSGLYTATASTGGCVSSGSSVTVTVNPNAAIALTSAAGTNVQTVCSNTAITTITYSISGSGTGATVTGLPAGLTGSFASGTFTISGTPSITGTFNYTVNTTGTCTQASATGSITINPDAAIVLTSVAGSDAQTLCAGTAINSITYSVSGGGTGATVSGLPAGLSGSFSGGTFTISGTSSATGTFNYTVTTTGTCAQSTATGSITINPDAAIALSSAAGTDAQTLCSNTAITNIAYTISGGGTGATASGLPAGISGSFAGGTFTISGTPSATGTFNYTVNTTGTCTQALATGSITINPDAAIVLTSAAGSDAQTTCTGNAITSITYDVTGGGTGATVSGLPAGLSGSFSAGTFTISGMPAATGTFSYTVTTTGMCAQTSATGSITVNPNSAVTLTSGAGTDAQTVCINTAITTITYSVSGASTASVTGLPSGVTSSFSGGILIISGTPGTSGLFNYTVNTSGSCAPAGGSGTINVGPDAAIALTSAAGTDAQSVCTGTAINAITYNVSGGATNASVTGLPAGITGSFAGGTFTISGTPTATGTFNYTINTAGTCTQTSATGSIIVNPGAVITLSSLAGTDAQTLCENTAINNISYAVSGSGTGATATGLPAGVTGSFAGGTFTISGTPTVSGTFNYTITTTGSCGQVSASGSITADPLPMITSVPSTNETSCGASDGTITINATGTGLTYSINGGTSFSASNVFTGLAAGSYSIVVQSASGCTQNGGTVSISSAGAPASPAATANPNPLCSGGTVTLSVTSPVPGETYNWSGPNSYTATGSTVTISNATPAMSGSYIVTAEVGGCVSPGNSVTVTVNPNANIVLTTPGPTASQTVCENAAIFNIVYEISGGATSAAVTGLPTGVTGTLSGSTFTISGTPIVTGTFNYTINTTGTCNQASISGTITVDPNASIAISAGSNSQTVCTGSAISAVSYTVSGGGSGATATGLPAGVSGSFSGGTFTISGTPTVTGTFNYTVNTTGSCTQASATGSITVNPDAAIALTSSSGTDAQSACTNSAINNITYSITGGGTGASVSGLPAGVSGTFAGGTFTISGTPTATGTFNYTINTTGSCAQASASGSITVNPGAVLALASGSSTQTLCTGTAMSPVSYSVSGGGTGATASGLPAGVSGTFSGGTFTISGTPTATGTFNYTVTTTGSCTQASASGSITVNPLQNASFAYPSSTFCQSAANPSPSISGAAGGTFTSSPGGLSIDPATGAITLSTSVINTYTVTYTTPGPCPNSSDVSITIITNPIATATSTGPVCENQSLSLNATGGGTYSWTGPAGYSSGVQSPLISSATASNNGTYTVTVTNGGCTDTAQVNVVVNALPAISAGSDQTITLGSAAALNASGGSSYSWSPASGLSCSNCPNPVATPSLTTTYCVNSANGSCSSTDCVTITVDVPCNTNEDLGMPNAFSPNGDDNNDLFCLQGWSECMDLFHILIYDRWGEKVFEASQTDFCWDGTFRGKALDPAVFVYIINASFKTGEKITKTGNISIIR